MVREIAVAAKKKALNMRAKCMVAEGRIVGTQQKFQTSNQEYLHEREAELAAAIERANAAVDAATDETMDGDTNEEKAE
ncbi:hypothetical protein BBJ28_00003083 [Nothophytophthora sp. Chile5]|nr:hypothetical protein BBJ28_00003083 [Nothophytophthora sp. Chile5]